MDAECSHANMNVDVDWGDSDDATFSPSYKLNRDYLFGELSLGQTLSVFEDGDFALTKALTIDNVLDELEKSLLTMRIRALVMSQLRRTLPPLVIDDDFVNDKVKKLLTSTKSKNTEEHELSSCNF